jgi:hypothetical protein
MGIRNFVLRLLPGVIAAAALSCGGDSPPAAPDTTPATLSLSAGTYVVGLGATYRIPATVRTADFTDITATTPIAWSSTDESVASIDAAGNVTGKALGTTQVTATVGSLTATAGITIAPDRVVIDAAPSALAVGTSVQLTATAFDAGGALIPATDVTWNSSAPGIATVDETGLMTALSSGNVVISATIAGRLESFGTLVGIPTQYDGSFGSLAGVSPPVELDVVFGRVVRFTALLRPHPSCSVSIALNLSQLIVGNQFSVTGGSPSATGTFASPDLVNGSVSTTIAMALAAGCPSGTSAPPVATYTAYRR